MKIHAELISETSFPRGKPARQSHGDSPAARAPESEAAMPAAASTEGSPAGAGRRRPGESCNGAGCRAFCRKGEIVLGRGDRARPSSRRPVAGDRAVRRGGRSSRGGAGGARPQGLCDGPAAFEALGRKDAAAAIENALAALDRKDYATAQGLFEALGKTGPGGALASGWGPAAAATAKPAASMLGPISFGSRGKAQQKPVKPAQSFRFTMRRTASLCRRQRRRKRAV